MERFHANHPSIQIFIRLQKLSEGLCRNITAARNGDVRMPGTKLRLNADRERGFLHALVNLKEMRVRFPDADPDNFWRAFRRECSHSGHRQKECAKLDGAEFLAQRRIDIVWNIIEEAKRQVHLSRLSPPHAANVRVKLYK